MTVPLGALAANQLGQCVVENGFVLRGVKRGDCDGLAGVVACYSN